MQKRFAILLLVKLLLQKFIVPAIYKRDVSLSFSIFTFFLQALGLIFQTAIIENILLGYVKDLEVHGYANGSLDGWVFFSLLLLLNILELPSIACFRVERTGITDDSIMGLLFSGTALRSAGECAQSSCLHRSSHSAYSHAHRTLYDQGQNLQGLQLILGPNLWSCVPKFTT